MNPAVLFQLTFTFIYITFSKKKFSFSKISGSQINPRTAETMNVVIDETSTSTTQKEVDQLPKSTLLSAPISNKVKEDPSPTSTPNISQSSNSNPVEDTPEPTTPPQPIGHIEREPSSRIKLNHPLEEIVGNMNELNLRK